ncbi:MAG: Gfo/Idh/MocA family oxidoreductase, partial [Paracoccaceae bacterium]
MLNIAVLGCGRIGRMHADNIARHADAELAMVYDVHVPSASAVAEQHGVPAASSPQEIFSSGQVDAVLIAT